MKCRRARFRDNKRGSPSTKGQHLRAVSGLKRRVFVKLVEHLARLGVPFELDDDAHTSAVRFVAQVRDTIQAPGASQLCNGIHGTKVSTPEFKIGLVAINETEQQQQHCWIRQCEEKRQRLPQI